MEAIVFLFLFYLWLVDPLTGHFDCVQNELAQSALIGQVNQILRQQSGEKGKRRIFRVNLQRREREKKKTTTLFSMLYTLVSYFTRSDRRVTNGPLNRLSVWKWRW